jgi:hypothetical protein
MAVDPSPRQSQTWVTLQGVDLKNVFRTEKLDGHRVQVPLGCHALPDFRPASEPALAEALLGVPPQGSGLTPFDPLIGPFAQDGASTSAWAQSLDFLRDIRTASIGSNKLLPIWVAGWLACAQKPTERSGLFFASTTHQSTKTDRLVWRARRVLNCFSHILPSLHKFEPEVQHQFWQVHMSDIAKIAAPTDTLWASLKNGFDPLSPRAMWLRAIALLGVEAAIPHIIKADLIDAAIGQVEASIQKDGLFAGGSIVGTLSAGADLCMLTRIPAIDPCLQRVRTALANLRHKDGKLVTFGTSAADYVQLLTSVVGPGQWRPANLFLDTGIVRKSAGRTVAWLYAPRAQSPWGPICALEVGGQCLVTSLATARSGPVLNDTIEAVSFKCKARDEPDHFILEINSTISHSGKNHLNLRQIRLSKTGKHVDGEDIFKSDSTRGNLTVQNLTFVIPSSCSCHMSKDGKSVLIVTSEQQAWRFRCDNLDIGVEPRPERTLKDGVPQRQHIVVCKPFDRKPSNDFRATWQFVLEDSE